jgi:tRNA A-37 threonylcarbamoyl transferase component Bud32
MVQAGMILAGKYQVERVLGQGGMGCVVSATHLQLGQRVAIKFLLPEALRIPEAVERFLREARAAVRLKSEHVGRVIDVGQFDDGAPYMVMEYLEGTDLSGYLQRSGPLPVHQVVDFVLQACEAIAEAHSIGIVHRDLKPANLFLTRAPDGGALVKVLDFGISKAQQGDGNFNLTRTTSVMGSPGYMSPEQLRSAKDCDARTDIWALGVILFELTTGRTPFGGDSITELALKVAMDPTPPLNLPGMPPGFDAVVGTCLGKDPAQRYPNVAELAAALVPFGPPSAMEKAMRVARVLQVSPSGLQHVHANQPTIAIGTGLSHGKPTTLSSAAGSAQGSFGPAGPARRRTALIAGIAGTALIVVGAVVFAVVGGGGTESGAADPAAGRQPEETEPVAEPPPAPEPDEVVAPPVVAEPVTPPPPPDVAPAVEADPAPAAAAAATPKVEPKPREPRKPRGKKTSGGAATTEDWASSRY